jgi:hypothetical protein
LKRLQLIVEGQTEETLAEQLLIPHFQNMGWIVGRPMIVKTKRVVDGPDFTGGLRTWAKIRPQINRVLGGEFDLVTTLFDYYGLPTDTPGMAGQRHPDVHERVSRLERAIAEDIGDRRFMPYLAVHETEALVFAARRELAALLGGARLATELDRIVEAAGGPELINDAPTTAPSKRLLSLIPTYQKRLDGPLAIVETGLQAVRDQCPHFDTWLTMIESAA